MRVIHIHRLLLACWLLAGCFGMASAQKSKEFIRVEENKMIVKFDRRQAEYGLMMEQFGLKDDSVFVYKNIGNLAREGWSLKLIDKNVAEISKPLDEGKSNVNWGKQPLYIESPGKPGIPGSPGFPSPVAYGRNSFKDRPTVFENRNDQTVFVLRGYPAAKKVILSGNFNNWSASGKSMLKTDSGWVAILKLAPGKYFYKFIVDGQWIHDPNNNLREPDGHKGYNSTYFHHNYTFRLNGYPSAKKVVVAGSFNEWNEKQLVMQKAPGGWELDLYLGTGSHTYKFIIDGAWLLDPENKVVRPDGQGHFNSAIALGDTSIFTLRGYTNARLVILTGNFNGWNTAELAMIKTATGWELPYVVAPGNHEYKYIVDGQWITDPGNPVTVGKGDTKNSVKPVKPNYTFVLKRYPNAREVWLSGNFNGWAEPGYQMVKKDGVWICPLHLSAGKYTYKFVVDGQWILDPDNPQREENEYSTGNSVLWIEPEGEFLQR